MTPKPKLWRKKRVTIAIGLIATDGVVIGADSQESTGILKSSQQKLTPLFFGVQLGSNPGVPKGVCVFTGAGDGGYIDAVTEDLMEVMYDNTLMHGHQIKKALGRGLKEFYKDHVIPFAQFPENDRPSMELLIAVQMHQHGLFVTDRSTLRNARPHGTVGIGGVVAKNILDTLWRPATVKQTATLAVYVLAMVKEMVEGCGKFSSVMMLHDWIIKDNPDGVGSVMVPPPQAATHLTSQEIFDLEGAFATEHAPAERDLMWDFIAKHS